MAGTRIAGKELVLLYYKALVMYLSSGIIGRHTLGILLNKRGMTDIAVEVGTHRGVFANQFLSLWEGELLYCVDPWVNPPGYDLQAKYLAGGGNNRCSDYLAAVKVSNKHKPRMRLIRSTSCVAVGNFRDNSLDLVYVDGDHRREFVKSDLERWYKKLKPGGLLAGHDIISANTPNAENNWGADIQPAVEEFAASVNRPIYLVPEPALMAWSFYLERE